MPYYNQMLMADFYKVAHREMYPEGTEQVYAVWVPRATRDPDMQECVVLGPQMYIKETLLEVFQRDFFERPKAQIVTEYVRIIRHALGIQNPHTAHIEALHDLGFLPLRIRALPEGSVVPIRTPILTVENTHGREFGWVTNYFETQMSCEIWGTITSATKAHQYRKLFDYFEHDTTGGEGFAQFQGHDFSFRGMKRCGDAIYSGVGHLASFVGTDTIPAILAAEYFYGANVERELVGTSVSASEHSIQCAYGDDVYFKRLLTEVHPSGIVSIVSDGYDFWDVMTRVVPSLRDAIMARAGKCVIRPDSGDPVKIVCGDPNGETEAERKGAMQLLWETFGGTTNALGYKLLDPHVGLIYGDAITYDRARRILTKLRAAGFASVNIVFGIGSYTYQHVTRDTLGQALKTTLVVINGEERLICKDPKTDDGIKKSPRGRVAVFQDADGAWTWSDNHRLDQHVPGNMLGDIFVDGKATRNETFVDIRARLAAVRANVDDTTNDDMTCPNPRCVSFGCAQHPPHPEIEMFQRYRRKASAEMRPYRASEVLSSRVSISAADREAGSPRVGDMIARNPKNRADQWLVAEQYARDNFERVES